MASRATDHAYPPGVFDLHPGCSADGVHVALNFLQTLANPDVDVWDSAVWDGTSPPVTWWSDETWVDVAGDVRGLVVTAGRNDLTSQPASAHLTMELDNSTGRYDQWDDTGQPVTAPFGQRIAVWEDDPGGWRFFGRVETWEQDYGSGPDADSRARQSRVTVEAFDAMDLLAQPIDGLTYDLGAEGDTTPARLGYLAKLAGFTRGTRLTPGNVTHRTMASTNPVLESMQLAAESDGGIVFVDVDGALAFFDRTTLVTGRTDAAQPVAVFSDSCSPGAWDFWEGDPMTDIAEVRTDVVLTNVDLIQSEASDQAATDRYGRRLLALQSQTWRTKAEGDALAAWLLARRSQLFFRVDSLALYRDFPDLRIGDRVRYVRTLTGGTRVDVDLIVEGFTWEHSPTSRLLRITTTPVSALNAYARWDTAVWDSDVWSY